MSRQEGRNEGEKMDTKVDGNTVFLTSFHTHPSLTDRSRAALLAGYLGEQMSDDFVVVLSTTTQKPETRAAVYMCVGV